MSVNHGPERGPKSPIYVQNGNQHFLRLPSPAPTGAKITPHPVTHTPDSGLTSIDSERHPDAPRITTIPSWQNYSTGRRGIELPRAPHAKRNDTKAHLEDAFGGFGPDSPEYENGPRLEIEIPDPESAVRWFQEATIPEGYLRTFEKFTTKISSVQHPGVKSVGICFMKTHEGNMPFAEILSHRNAYTPPSLADNNDAINLKEVGSKLLFNYLLERLKAVYQDKIEANTVAKTASIKVDDVTLYLGLNNGQYGFYVTPNGTIENSGYNVIRHDSAAPSDTQLANELNALKDTLPTIAEAFADFFGTQLPARKILVEYSPEQNHQEETKNTAPQAPQEEHSDPIAPDRLAKLRRELVVTPREDDFKYIGGLGPEIAKLQEGAVGFSHPEAFRAFGVNPPRGILLKGPPGTGKTTLAMAFARETGAVLLSVKPSNIKSAFHGETERNIKGVFELADQLVREGKRVIMFFDEIEAIAPARDSFGTSNIDTNVTTEILQGMNADRPNCMIIAATNIPGLVDPALINNSSRFSVQLEIGLPNAEARTEIITKLLEKFTDKSTANELTELFEITEEQIASLASDSDTLTGADIENAIRKILVAKAVQFATTGTKPGPVKSDEIYRSLKSAVIAKDNQTNNYL